VDIEKLAERQVVQDLMSLTRALHHRADRLSWLALLRSPCCGLTLHDLHALAGNDHLSTIWRLMQDEDRVARLSPDGRERLAFVRGVLAEALAHRGRQSTRRWVEASWRCLGGAELLCDAADAADAEAFLTLVDELEAAGRFSIDVLAEAVEDLYAAPAAEAGAAQGSLQFMTIHKSKGLEFDCVILPELNDGSRRSDSELMVWESVALDGLDESLVAAPLTRVGDGPSPYRYLQGLEAERMAHEGGRLLYVAVTRARERLHLVAHLCPTSKGERRPAKGSFLELLWPALAADFAATPEPESPTMNAPVAAVLRPLPPLVRVVRPAIPPSLVAELRDTTVSPDQSEVEDEPDGLKLDADIGTLAHAYLERIAIDGPEAWSLERCAQLMPAMEVWLARRGHEGTALAEALARVGDSLRRTLESAEGRWVLALRADAAAELVLARAEARGFSTHIVDRTFVEDGVRWIVDYKTARPAGDEASLRAHAEGYREQLERYASLFRDEGLPIRAGIFYTALGRWIALGELS
jgi:ATP-dependent exoDNAse (exonuclease V) beta subunit